MVLHCSIDGGACPNPGLGAVGYCLKDAAGAVLKIGGRLLKGTVTNNEAEFAALVIADWHIEREVKDVEYVIFYTDSQLVYKILTNQWKLSKSKPYGKRAILARQVFQKNESNQIHWIPRERNSEADDRVESLLRAVAKKIPKNWKF